MSEQELRALIRGVIAQGGRGDDVAVTTPSGPSMIPLPLLRQHASHALFVIPAPGDHCVIEPSVTCNHCGYCQSYGH
jgi:hypothetical protein